MGILKNMSNFVLFFNMIIFILSIISSENLGLVNININFGAIHINSDISLYAIIPAIIGIFGIIIVVSFIPFINDNSSILLVRILSFIILYGITSMFTLTFLEPLKTFGSIIYVLFTILYGIGFVEKSGDS